MLDPLGWLLGLLTPEAAATLVVRGVLIGGTGWLIACGLFLRRERDLLRRVQALFDADPLREATATEFSEHWAAAGGSSLPKGWVTDRVHALIQVRAGGPSSARALSALDERGDRRRAIVFAALAITALGVGLAGFVGELAQAISALFPLIVRAQHAAPQTVLLMAGGTLLAGARGALSCAASGLGAALFLGLLGALFSQLQQALRSHFERISLTVLEPRILPAGGNAPCEGFIRSLEESSRRIEAAVAPFAAGLDRFTEQWRAGSAQCAQRLENASHNVLQAVEGMREAAAELRQGTAGLSEGQQKLERLYEQINARLTSLAESPALLQAPLGEIAGQLHGITQALTTVVASANETQSAASQALGAITETAEAVHTSAGRVEAAMAGGTGVERAGSSAPPEGVTLRCLAEQQQQFLNVLDHRLGRLERLPIADGDGSQPAEPGQPQTPGGRSRLSWRETLRSTLKHGNRAVSRR